MAEAAAVASIVGIASFGIKLTKVLYDFGSNVSSAREQTSYIARHVDLYANVLDILTERIDDEEPILSDAAFDLIDELKYQSNELFTMIEQSLPSPKEGKDDISFLQKVKWNFTKSRVALLVGELDYLRSTVHLLITIIFTGRKIRSRSKRKAKSSKDGAPDLDNDLRKQGLKAQNALLAHHDALEKLPELEKEAERQENSSSDDMSQASTQPPNTRTDVVCTSTTAFAELQQSLSVYTDPTERQRVVLQRSVHVLQQLLQQWTTVDLSAPTGASQEQQAQSANQQQPTATAFSGEDWTETMKNSASRSSLPNRSKPAKPADDALPPGWTKHRDPATGRFYYYDTNTLKTQSEVPSATISDVPAFKRRSTPYASTTKERTFVGERSQSSIPQSTTESAGFNAEDFLARVFDRYGASKSNNFGTKVRDPNTCWACNGHGGRKDKIKTCQRCNGSGLLTEMRQRGSLMQRFQPVCPQCNGEGDMIREKYRCKVCNGTKKHPRNSSYEPEPKPHQETFHEEGTPRQFQAPPSGQQANKGGDEDEPGTEVQCASQ